jgi:hypothetical protein
MPVSAPKRAPISQKLLDAMNDGRQLTSVPLSKLPGAKAKADATAAEKTFGVSASSFQFGKSSVYVIDKNAEDAFDQFDFYSSRGKLMGTQEVDL